MLDRANWDEIEARARQELTRRRGLIHPATIGAPGPDAPWYIAEGQPMAARARVAELKRMGLPPCCEMFVPMERVDLKAGRGGIKRIRDLPLFGPYFFVRMDLQREGREAESLAGARLESVRSIDGVRGFVGLDGFGWPKPVTDIHTLDRLRATPVVKRQAAAISVGDAVRLLQGPMAGFEGTVARVMGRLDKRQRLVILLTMLGGSVPVEISTEHIQSIDRVG